MWEFPQYEDAVSNNLEERQPNADAELDGL
jgi:hypothetical protein